MTIVPDFDIRGLTVLLVEDSWLIGSGIQNALENMGVVISNPVDSVAEARSVLETVTFDVALVDMSLRDAQAHPLIDDLERRGIPFIVVSGNKISDDVARRALAVFSKPLRFDALLVVLRAVKKSVAA